MLFASFAPGRLGGVKMGQDKPRIIVEADRHGGWAAWFDGRAHDAWRGDTARAAVTRLLQVHGISETFAEADDDAAQPQRQVFRLKFGTG